jgi:hypothetical protein
MSNTMSTPLAWWKTPWVLWSLAAVVVAAGLLTFLATRQPSEVRFVQGARLAGHPDEPLGLVLEQFLGAPQWQASRAADGQHYVTVSGGVDYLGATMAVLRFRVDTEHGSLALAGLTLDGRPKDTLVQSDFLRRAYAHYEKVLLRR